MPAARALTAPSQGGVGGTAMPAMSSGRTGRVPENCGDATNVPSGPRTNVASSTRSPVASLMRFGSAISIAATSFQGTVNLPFLPSSMTRMPAFSSTTFPETRSPFVSSTTSVARAVGAATRARSIASTICMSASGRWVS